MPKISESTSNRKKEHIDLCLTDEVSFKEKRNGFDNYEFKHYAVTEVDINKIDFKVNFLNKEINYPFIISCMTGGTAEAENINSALSVAANELKIPIGVGSQRQALEDNNYHNTYKVIRKNAPDIPVLGNIGASQISKFDSISNVQFLVDLIHADAMVIHFNPAQELIQNGGEPQFNGILKRIEELVKILEVPVIVKEVGAGISKEAAEKLLKTGIKGIDIAGAGGTSWTGVEMLSSKDLSQNEFWDWGLPTSYCLRTVSKLKNNFDFTLIGSGGIYNAFDIAKAYALGADIAASARIILQVLNKSGTAGVVRLIKSWYDTIRKIMFLTGSQTLDDLRKKKLIRKDKLF